MGREGIILVFSLIFISFISASFQVGVPSHSIEMQYGPSEPVSGWINMSLAEESGDSLFENSNGKFITLLNLLKTNEKAEYSCNIKDCKSDYAIDGESIKNLEFYLKPDEKKTVGIKLNGEIKSISYIKLNLTSDAAPSCHGQLEVDILNDNSPDFVNEKIYLIGSSCESSLSGGCFNTSKTSEQYSIGKTPYKHCQKITLPASPGFEMGAWINNQTGDTRTVVMSLYTLSLEKIEVAKCNLPPVVGSGSSSCKINYSIKESSPYYVCIYSEKNGTAKLRGYSDKVNGCGFYQESERNPEENAAFDIFIKGLGFDSVGIINISDSSEGTTSKIKNYIYNTYGSYDCNENICIIPISIKAHANQNLYLKDVMIEYGTNLGGGVSNLGNFYSVEETSPKISSEFQKIYLDYANLSVSSEYGNKTFNLKLNGENIFSEYIQIKEFPRITGVFPTTVPSFLPATFIMSTTNGNITTYTWDFNDSTQIQTTTTNQINHTYNRTGVYNVKVGIRDSFGNDVSKTFEILATIPLSQLQSKLEEDLKTLENAKVQISTFDEVSQEGLNSVLRIKELEENLKFLQREYNFASEEEDYSKIAANLSMLNVPELIAITKEFPSFSFFPLEEQIDLETLKSVGGGNYIVGQERDYKSSILIWQLNNVEAKVTMKEFSAVIRGEGAPVLNTFVITIKNDYSQGDVYLFIKKMKDLKFKEKYFEKESGNYYYWTLDNENKRIEFSTSEVIAYESTPLFISPELSTFFIESQDVPPAEQNIVLKWTIISISLIFLLFIAIVIYSLLAVWYKRKYESYLFRNRNDLYNLIMYVNASKKRGEKESDMIANLKRAGWTGEQITYVIKKYSGKRTGLIELPLTKLIDRILGNYKKPIPPQQQRPNPRGPFLDKNRKVL